MHTFPCLIPTQMETTVAGTQTWSQAGAEVVYFLPSWFPLLEDTERLDVGFYRLSCCESSDFPKSTEQVGPAQLWLAGSSGSDIRHTWVHTLASPRRGPVQATETPQDLVSPAAW